LECDRKLRSLSQGDSSLPLSNYGHYFHTQDDGRWLVSDNSNSGAYVRHLPQWFDESFAENNEAFQNCSIVLGMHPDEVREKKF